MECPLTGGKHGNYEFERVLILVLMECPLTKSMATPAGISRRLNPCSNGMPSD